MAPEAVMVSGPQVASRERAVLLTAAGAAFLALLRTTVTLAVAMAGLWLVLEEKTP